MAELDEEPITTGDEEKENIELMNDRTSNVALGSFDTASEKSATLKRHENETKSSAKNENPPTDSENKDPFSLFIFVEKNPEKPGSNWMDVRLTQAEHGENGALTVYRTLPVKLNLEKVMILARCLEIFRPDESYEIKRAPFKFE